VSAVSTLDELAGSLGRRGFKEIEVYAKRGRSRRVARFVPHP